MKNQSKKENKVKINLAMVGFTLFAVGVPIATLANDDLLVNEEGRCVILDPNGGGCVPSPVGNSGRETTNNTSTRFWSTHTTRQHRPVGTIGNTEIRPTAWGNAGGTRHWTTWQSHSANASLRNSWETR